MSTPSPATFAKQIREKKLNEAVVQSPSNSTAKPVYKASPSSEKAKATGTSSRSATRSSTSKKDTSSKPATSSDVPPLKKPFERKPHLTQRLSSNEELRKLRDSLPTSSTSKKK